MRSAVRELVSQAKKHQSQVRVTNNCENYININIYIYKYINMVHVGSVGHFLWQWSIRKSDRLVRVDISA